MVHPRLTSSYVPINWTNNAVESFNSLLKHSIDWKPQSILKLLKTMRDIVEFSKQEIMSSFYGQGNWMMLPDMRKKCYYNLAVWSAMDEEAQEKVFAKFTSGLPKRPSPQTTSTDGSFSMPTPSGVKKKPGQRRRPKAERTSSAPKATKSAASHCESGHNSDDDFQEKPSSKKSKLDSLLGFSKWKK